MIRKPSFWPSLVSWISSWASGARRAAIITQRRQFRERAVIEVQHPDLYDCLRAVDAAKARRDSRGLHYAIEAARAARTEALKRELSR